MPSIRLHHLIQWDTLSVRMKYTKSGKGVLMSTVNEFFYRILSTQQFAPRFLHHAFLTFKFCKRMSDNLFEIYSCGMLLLSENLRAVVSQSVQNGAWNGFVIMRCEWKNVKYSAHKATSSCVCYNMLLRKYSFGDRTERGHKSFREISQIQQGHLQMLLKPFFFIISCKIDKHKWQIKILIWI